MVELSHYGASSSIKRRGGRGDANASITTTHTRVLWSRSRMHREVRVTVKDAAGRQQVSSTALQKE